MLTVSGIFTSLHVQGNQLIDSVYENNLMWKFFFYSKTLKGLILIQCRINELSFLYLSETCVSGQVLEIILESIQKIKGTRLLH